MSIDKNSVIGIVGAGIMGRGIAQVAARSGHKVILFDSFDNATDNAIKANEKDLSKLVSKNKITQEKKDKIISLITPSMDINDLAPCDLVIEAIIENKEIKKDLFLQIEKICKDVVIASNTSSISISSLANGLQYPNKVIGIHFFNPAPIMKLVEIIYGLQSDMTIIKEAYELISSWGKKAVYVKSSPGFIVNRIARPFYAEALRLYEEGVSDFATIDEAVRSGGKFRMGPFELMDLIGNDTNYSVTVSTFNSYYQDQRFHPSLTQEEYSQAGLFGRKTGTGFYKYEDSKQLNRDLINTVKASACDIKTIKIFGNLACANPLIKLFENTSLNVEKYEGDNYIEFNNTKLFLTNGKMASEISNDLNENDIAQFDINIDFENTKYITIATSLLANESLASDIAALFSLINKEVLLVKDSPALVIARTITMLINEAASTVNNGVCDIASADIAMENGVNYPMGPFKWADYIGIESVLEILNNLENFYKDSRYRANRNIIEQSILKKEFYAK